MQTEIVRVEKPSDFKKVGFSEAEWKSASPLPMTLPHRTALENIRLSRGLYRIVNQVDEATKVLQEKSNAELKAMALAQGIQIQKQMSKDKLISLLRQKFFTDDEGAELTPDPTEMLRKEVAENATAISAKDAEIALLKAENERLLAAQKEADEPNKDDETKTDNPANVEPGQS